MGKSSEGYIGMVEGKRMNREKHCWKCNKGILAGEERSFFSHTLCEDCYIDATLENARKAPYLECGHSFMLRLRPGFDNRRLIKPEDNDN